MHNMHTPVYSPQVCTNTPQRIHAHTCTHTREGRQKREKMHNCLLLHITRIWGNYSTQGLEGLRYFFYHGGIAPDPTGFCLFMYLNSTPKSGPNCFLHSRLNSFKEMAITARRPPQAASLGSSTLPMLGPLLPSVPLWGQCIHLLFSSFL